MYKFTIKGDTPEQLEANIQQFVRSRTITITTHESSTDQDISSMYPTNVVDTNKEEEVISTTQLLIQQEAQKTMLDPIPFNTDPELKAADSAIKSQYPESIDGYKIAPDGRVWLPVEGRSGAYRGVQYEDYVKTRKPLQSVEAQAVPVGSPNLGELDSAGMPYDLRIHTSQRSTVKNGTWKYKRGVDDILIAQVEAENKALLASGPKVAEPLPPAPVSPFPAQPPIMQAVPTQPLPEVLPASIPSQAAAPVQVAVQPAYNNVDIPQGDSLAFTVETFKLQLLSRIFPKLIETGKINQEWIQQVKQSFQIKELWDLTDAHMVALYDTFANYGLITKLG